jgi:HEAT repeat protein
MREWPDYLQLGLASEHVPELIRMAADEDLHFADSDSLEVWAPVHAWRALGQLRAEVALKPLLELLERFADDIKSDDYALDELPEVFGLIGRTALPDLTAYLQDDEHLDRARIAATSALRCVAEHDPATRDEIVAILLQQLQQFDVQDEGFNGFLISDLVDLKAQEALFVIEQAFAAGAVDEMIMGDWEDVQIKFGLKAERETPRPNYFLKSFPPEPEELLQAVADETKRPRPLGGKAAKNEKAKHKQAKKTRKKNRKK